jgi:hypothetical protein
MAGGAAAIVTVGPGPVVSSLNTMRMFMRGDPDVVIDMADFVLSGAW